MQGTFDDASLRLAKALRRSPEQVEAALADVGVDAPYLSRALSDGDPQGTLDAVSVRLGIPQRDLVMALLRSSGDARGAPAATPSAEAEAIHDFLSRGLPTLLGRASAVALVLGVGMAALASLALLNPTIFRAVLVYAAAAFIALAALLLLVASWRMRRAARALRLGRRREPATKR